MESIKYDKPDFHTSKVKKLFRYTHSRLETYLNCKDFFRKKYLYEIESKPKFEQVKLMHFEFGSAFHTVMEKFNNRIKSSEKVSEEDLVSEFINNWKKLSVDEIKLATPQQDYRYYTAAGIQWIKDAYEYFIDFYNDGRKIVGVEEKDLEFDYEYEDSNISGDDKKIKGTIWGIVDLIEKKPNNNYVIRDYKTSSSGIGFFNWFFSFPRPLDRQLVLYKKMVESNMNGKVESLEWYYPKWNSIFRAKMNPGFFYRVLGYKNQDTIMKETLSLIIEINSRIIQFLQTEDEVKRKRLFEPCGKSSCDVCGDGVKRDIDYNA